MHKEKMLLKSTSVYSGIQVKFWRIHLPASAMWKGDMFSPSASLIRKTDETYGIFTSKNYPR